MQSSDTGILLLRKWASSSFCSITFREVLRNLFPNSEKNNFCSGGYGGGGSSYGGGGSYGGGRSGGGGGYGGGSSSYGGGGY
jgi:hypothetical protein